MELLDDGGGDNPVSTKVEDVVTEAAVVTEPEPVEAAVVSELPELLLSQEPGGTDEDWPRKLSPWYCKVSGSRRLRSSTS